MMMTRLTYIRQAFMLGRRVHASSGRYLGVYNREQRALFCDGRNGQRRLGIYMIAAGENGTIRWRSTSLVSRSQNVVDLLQLYYFATYVEGVNLYLIWGN